MKEPLKYNFKLELKELYLITHQYTSLKPKPSHKITRIHIHTIWSCLPYPWWGEGP